MDETVENIAGTNMRGQEKSRNVHIAQMRLDRRTWCRRHRESAVAVTQREHTGAWGIPPTLLRAAYSVSALTMPSYRWVSSASMSQLCAMPIRAVARWIEMSGAFPSRSHSVA